MFAPVPAPGFEPARGYPPLTGDAPLVVQMRNGWIDTKSGFSRNAWRWEQTGSSGDIVAWRWA